MKTLNHLRIDGLLLTLCFMLVGCTDYDRLAKLGLATSDSDWRAVYGGAGGKRVEDADLIEAVPYLKSICVHELHLDAEHISDRAIPYIVQLKSLKVLNLAGTDVTISGLRELRTLPKLKRLYISESYYKSEDLQQLSRLLPETTICNDWRGTEGRKDRGAQGHRGNNVHAREAFVGARPDP